MPTLKAEFSDGNDNGATVHSPPATKAAVGGSTMVKAAGTRVVDAAKAAAPRVRPRAARRADKFSSDAVTSALHSNAAAEASKKNSKGKKGAAEPKSVAMAAEEAEGAGAAEEGAGAAEEGKEAEGAGAAEEGKEDTKGEGGEEGEAMPYEHTVILFDISKLTYDDDELKTLKTEMVTALEKKAKTNIKINPHSISVTGVKPNGSMIIGSRTGRTYKYKYLGITLDLTNLYNETNIEYKDIFEICNEKCRESFSSLLNPTYPQPDIGLT